MPTRLEITLEGEAPGFAEHGLSLGAFHPALWRLLKAIRRIGSAILTDATGEEYGAKGGRWARYAASLDFVIHEVHSGSPLQLAGSIVQPDIAPSTLFPDWSYFTDQVGDRLVNSIRKEGTGQADNYLVREYLNAIQVHDGIDKQSYVLIKSTGETNKAQLEHPKLISAPRELPFLQELTGWVTGVGFDPGRVEVRLKFDSQFHVFTATKAQVERALEMRDAEVRALVVRGGATNRILRLDRMTDPKFQPTKELEERFVWEKWAGVLARLAQ